MKQLLLILLLIVACTAKTDISLKNESEQVFCAQDVKECSDGTYVSRNPDKGCDFDSCPVVKKNCPLDTKECPGGIFVPRDPSNNCEFSACPFQVDRNFYASYKVGRVDYVAKVPKPTPCHTFNLTQQIVNTNPPQLVVDLITINPPNDVVCIQVESEENIKGYILVDAKPSSLTLNVDGIMLYSTKEFE